MWKIPHKRKNGTYVNDEAIDIRVSTNNIYQFWAILDTVLDYFGHHFGNICFWAILDVVLDYF